MIRSPRATPHAGTETGPGFDPGLPGAAAPALDGGCGGYAVLARAQRQPYESMTATTEPGRG